MGFSPLKYPIASLYIYKYNVGKCVLYKDIPPIKNVIPTKVKFELRLCNRILNYIVAKVDKWKTYLNTSFFFLLVQPLSIDYRIIYSNNCITITGV